VPVLAPPSLWAYDEVPMDTERLAERLPSIPIIQLPQCVPSRVCFSCDVCCRFPEPDSFLRPYFTAAEIQAAVAHGLAPARFPDPDGSQIALVPNESGEGYLCPAFDQATSHCRIYEARPLDCQIYPLALMWSADRRAVVLGWDTKCPFLRDSFQGLDAHADQVAALIEQEDMLETFVRNPRLIGRFQDDVLVLRSLPKLTERLGKGQETNQDLRPDGFQPATDSPLAATRSPLALRPLTLADRPRFEAAVALVDTPLAHYAFAPHYIWRHLFAYSWAEMEGHVCLFAEYADGVFMPLPPLARHAAHVMRDVFAACFALMRERNRGSAVTRIENVPEELRPPLESMGYVLKPKDPDYLYRAEDLAALAGDRYKSQRAACNRFEREQQYRFEPYRDEERTVCLALFREWAAQKQTAGLEEAGRYMLADSESAHRETLLHHRALGLVGRVARVGGAIRAYTFGYARSAAVFCVLLEVADRSIPGLAQFIFRSLCREAAAQGYVSINSLDDSGLPGLARSKQAYHPVDLVPSYVASE